MPIKLITTTAIEFDPQFWRHPQKWPHDPPNYMFLARAFQEMGRVRYDPEWADRYIEPEEPHEDCDEAAEEQYERDCAEAKLKFENMRASIARTIVEQSELGRLMTAIRHTTGGSMIALGPEFWNTEYFGPRFLRCQMSADQPFIDPRRVSPASRYWIYVTSASFEQCTGVSSTEVAVVNPLLKGHTSPKRWRYNDEPLIEEMHQMCRSGEASSPHDAARQLAEKAGGVGTVTSRQTRLHKRYREKYPND